MLKLAQYGDSSDESSDDDDGRVARLRPAPGPKQGPTPPPSRLSLAALPTPKTTGDGGKRNMAAEMAEGLAALKASKKAETVKITIPGLGLGTEDNGEDDEEEYMSLAKRARIKSKPSGALLDCLPQPSQGMGMGVAKGRRAVVNTDTGPSGSGTGSGSSAKPAQQAPMMMPYSMKGKKQRNAIIAKKRGGTSSSGPADADADDSDGEEGADFLSSLSGPSNAASERRAQLMKGLEGVVDTSALIQDPMNVTTSKREVEEEEDFGPVPAPAEAGGGGYAEVAYYPEVGGSGYPEVDSTQNYGNDAGLEELMTKHERRKRQRGDDNVEIIDINGARIASGVAAHEMHQFNQEQSMYTAQSANYKAQGHEKRKNQLSYLLQKSNSDKMRLAQKWASGRANQQAAQSRYGF